MKLALPERSQYFKGLLILMGRDRIIDPQEREIIIQAGRVLDFEKRFCDAAIDELLRNRHITHEPVTFADHMIAECFLRDGIALSLVDGEIHPHELTWLKAVALANGLTKAWLDMEIRRFLKHKNSKGESVQLAIQSFL